MKFLAHEILDPPTDCNRQNTCNEAVGNMALLVTTMSALTQELMPDSPQQHGDAYSEHAATMVLANGIISVLPAVMEKRVPSAERCGGCVVSHALNVLKDSGAV